MSELFDDWTPLDPQGREEGNPLERLARWIKEGRPLQEIEELALEIYAALKKDK